MVPLLWTSADHDDARRTGPPDQQGRGVRADRSRNVGSQIGAAFKSLAGGELKGMTNL
jgi:hypothetical protein